MAYLLDADVLIRAKNLHYGMDFCPAFWQWLESAHQQGTVFSVEKVGDEIQAGDDELAEWARQRGARFFLAPDATVHAALGQVSRWVMAQHYEPSAVNTFFQVADYYLVGHALAGQHVVVTHEVPSQSTRKVKIPDVCLGLGIRYASPFDMLRREHARFVLGSVEGRREVEP